MGQCEGRARRQRQAQRPRDKREPDCAHRPHQDGQGRGRGARLGGDKAGEVGRAAEIAKRPQNHLLRSPDTAPLRETSSPPRAPAGPLGPCSRTGRQRAVSGALLRAPPQPPTRAREGWTLKGTARWPTPSKPSEVGRGRGTVTAPATGLHTAFCDWHRLFGNSSQHGRRPQTNLEAWPVRKTDPPTTPGTVSLRTTVDGDTRPPTCAAENRCRAETPPVPLTHVPAGSARSSHLLALVFANCLKI